MYTEKQQSSSITVDEAKKTNSSQTKEVKPSNPPSLSNHSVGDRRDYEDNWISPRVLGCRGPVAANLHVAFPCLKGRPKKKKTGRSFCVSKTNCVLQVYFRSKSWRQIWWCVNQHFEYTFYQCFYIYDLRETVLCLCASF